MIATVLLAAHLLFGPLFPPPEDWFAEDKLKHFFTSFVLTSLSASGARIAGADAEVGLWVGAGVAASAGLYKEVRDARVTGVFSTADLVWNVGGIAAAASVVHAGR